jgi:hypothetical protein
VSISAASLFTQTTFLDVLATAASNQAASQSKIEIDLINGQIQNQLQAKIAALQNTPDDAVTGALQTQITTLQSQASAASSIGSQFGANANILADLQNQLGSMQTAAAAGDAAGFDAAGAAANIDVGDLGVIAPTAPYQPDQVDGLQANGLGIGDSASYDLATPQGQAAATADVQTAQNLVGEIFQATTSNQVVAGSIATALTTQINNLTSYLSQLQQIGETQTTTKIQQLTQQAQDQSHLIQLALGNTQLLSNTLMQATNPPQPYTSPFDALEGGVGGAASSGSTQAAPAVLSLLA